MRRVLDDDDDLHNEDEHVGSLPLGLEKDGVDGGLPTFQHPSQAAVSESDDEVDKR